MRVIAVYTNSSLFDEQRIGINKNQGNEQRLNNLNLDLPSRGQMYQY